MVSSRSSDAGVKAPTPQLMSSSIVQRFRSFRKVSSNSYVLKTRNKFTVEKNPCFAPSIKWVFSKFDFVRIANGSRRLKTCLLENARFPIAISERSSRNLTVAKYHNVNTVVFRCQTTRFTKNIPRCMPSTRFFACIKYLKVIFSTAKEQTSFFKMSKIYSKFSKLPRSLGDRNTYLRQQQKLYIRVSVSLWIIISGNLSCLQTWFCISFWR